MDVEGLEDEPPIPESLHPVMVQVCTDLYHVGRKLYPHIMVFNILDNYVTSLCVSPYLNTSVHTTSTL